MRPERSDCRHDRTADHEPIVHPIFLRFSGGLVAPVLRLAWRSFFQSGGLSRVLRGAYLGLSVEALNSIPTHVHGRLYLLDEGRVREVVADASAPPPEALLG
jgi:hypothetical protein